VEQVQNFSRMKIASVVLYAAFCTLAFGQNDSADRVAPPEAAPPKDNFAVKLIRPLGPYENAGNACASTEGV
jgi:hypothetical protein